VLSPHPLSAALGAGFYRHWHVPSPAAEVDPAQTRGADLSVIGPAAAALLATGAWALARLVPAVLLGHPLTTPLAELPLSARLLALAGALGAVLALLWWVTTAGVRLRLAHGLARGSVVRVPDDPADPGDPDVAGLHAAVADLGRTLRDLPCADAVAGAVAREAFEVLRAGAQGLRPAGTTDAERRRLRRRCLEAARGLRELDGCGDRPRELGVSA
jgi:hypothetical protein